MGRRKTGSLVFQSGSWRLRITSPSGRRRWIALRTADRKTAEGRASMLGGWVRPAMDDEAWYRSLADLGKWAEGKLGTGAAAPSPAMEAAWEAWKEASRAGAGTMRVYDGYWRRWAAWADGRGLARMGDVEEADASAYAAALEAEGRASASRAVELLRRVWKGATGQPGPFGGVTVRDVDGGRYRRLTDPEAMAVWRAACRGEHGEWCGDLVMLGWWTGLRLQDAAGVRLDMIDSELRALRITLGKTRRSKPRPILLPLAPEPWAMIERRAAVAVDGWLFPAARRRESEAGGYIPRVASTALAAAFGAAPDTAAGKASYHSLRATFISKLDEAGVPVTITDAITGHASQGMHARYSQPGAEAMRRAIDGAISPLAASPCGVAARSAP